MLFVVFGPSLSIQGVLHGVGTWRDHLTFHQVAYHFKVMFGCFGHLRDKCLKLGPLARNLQAIHQPLRIWGSLTCRIKAQHQSHPTDPPRAPQLAAFSCLCHHLPVVRTLDGFQIRLLIWLPRIPFSPSSPGL